MATDNKSKALALWDLLIWASRVAVRYLSKFLVCAAKRIAIMVLNLGVSIGIAAIILYAFYYAMTTSGILTPNTIYTVKKMFINIHDKVMENPKQSIETIKMFAIWIALMLPGCALIALIFTGDSSETRKLKARVKALEDQSR